MAVTDVVPVRRSVLDSVDGSGVLALGAWRLHPAGRPMSDVALQGLTPDLWVASRPLPMWIGDIGCRMTIVRIGGDLLLHSPVPLDSATRSALDSIGRVRWIVGPNRVHHFCLADYARA